MSTIEMGDSEVVSVHVGDLLEWHLVENPSTGYQWTVSVDSGLAVRDVHTEHAGTTSPGAAAQRVIRAEVLRDGDWYVRLTLARSWESDSLEHKDVRVIAVR